jgi:lipoprotein-anchoring transpeptidase ErfK/SrfK
MPVARSLLLTTSLACLLGLAPPPVATAAAAIHHPTEPLPHTPAIRPQPRTETPRGAAVPSSRELVLDRSARLLTVLEAGRELRRFPVAVGRPGWETPVGRFEVIELVANPTWEHPATGVHVPPGPDNPLGSRWIGFHHDCEGRRGFNGVEVLKVEGCVSSGFHGTPQRESVGRAVSHGCVRLLDEHVRELFDLVSLGTPVTVLP